MDMKYYDLLSTAIIGVVVVAIVNYFLLGNIVIESVACLAVGYMVGYFINAIGSLLEDVYYRAIGGRPSDKLLTPVEGQRWTGYSRVKFYDIEKATRLLKGELNNNDATTSHMFSCAMREVNSCMDSRVPAFNAQYAWSRTLLTAVWMVDVVMVFHYYDQWKFWLIGLLLLVLSWNRYKERGYYYAREVLNEYIKQTENVTKESMK